jgi:squalene monooxygenase
VNVVPYFLSAGTLVSLFPSALEKTPGVIGCPFISPKMSSTAYDVVIVGAGIAGSALAHALATITSASRPIPLRIALLERSLAEPDRIVGELLQPGGVRALKMLGMEECLEGIDAIPVHGYCVYQAGQSVHIPYPAGHQGRSFHHGRFIMRLREKARHAPSVDVIEATATDLLECELTRRIIGVKATRDGEKEDFFADLVVIADGCFSNFRNSVMKDESCGKARVSTRSHFVGAVLEHARLPIPQHGTVALVKGHGPVLLYQISEHSTRMLVDVKVPLPSDLKVSCRYSSSQLVFTVYRSHTSSITSFLNYHLHSMSRFSRLSKTTACDECPTLFFPQLNKAVTNQKKA